MDTHAVLDDIKKRKLKPVYLLQGDEAYYIDLLSNAFENQVLDDSQKGFDQTILYGKDTDLGTIVNIAKRYPMMSDYQVVLVKEAQDIKWNDDELLIKYLENPTPTTVIIFAYKYGSIDKRKKITKSIEKVGGVVNSKKIYDNEVPGWITQQFRTHSRSIDPRAAALMGEYLGNNLSKISNEIEKLLLNVDPKKEISTLEIESNIGISKDFNVFELNAALATKNMPKALQIVDYFASNPKANNIVVILGSLGGYFTKVLKYHYLPDKNSKEAAKELGVHPFFVKDYEQAARNYNRRKTFDVIHLIHEFDLKSKGMNVGPYTNTGDLLKELVFKIIH